MCEFKLILSGGPHNVLPPYLLPNPAGWFLMGPFPLAHSHHLVTADSWWAEMSLLEYLRSADPTGVSVRKIILVVKLGLKQPGSRG